MFSSLSEKKRILCAEDEAGSSEFLKYLLLDYEIIFANSIEKALELFRSLNFELCLLDYWSTEGEGFALCKQIRLLNPIVPIIFASGVWQEDEIQKILDAGAQSYLIKPYEIEKLLKIVKELLKDK